MRLSWGTRRISSWLLIAGLWVACAVTHAQPSAPAVVLTDDALAGLPIGHFVEVLEDPGGALTLSDAQSPQHVHRFERSRASMLGIGFTKSAYWVRFQATNPRSSAL